MSEAAATTTAPANVTAEQTVPATPYELSAEKMMQDNLLILGLLFFIFYFILIRPQQKRVRSHQDMVKTLKKGDKVATGGGIIGTIHKFEGDDIVVVEIAPSVKVRAMRSAISEVIGDKPAAGESANDN